MVLAGTNAIKADLLCRLSDLQVPLLYFVGHSVAMAVSAKYIGRKTLELPQVDLSVTKIFPKRWLSMHGTRIDEIWDAALRATIGLVHLKPAISQVRRRLKLRSETHSFFRRSCVGSCKLHMTASRSSIS